VGLVSAGWTEALNASLAGSPFVWPYPSDDEVQAELDELAAQFLSSGVDAHGDERVAGGGPLGSPPATTTRDSAPDCSPGPVNHRAL
jgi:hypothetical protein